MANEFKIRKGLIVEGASGGTVVDVQGSQGQLFSVTDNLSGSIFAVSDISGVPIMTVNSSGVSYFDGNVGIGTTSPDSKLDVNGGATLNTGVPLRMRTNATLLDSTEFRTGNGEFKMYSGRVSSSHQSFVFATGDNYTSGSTRMVILGSNGNVGIGTTSPSEKLEVVGNIVGDGTLNTQATITVGNGQVVLGGTGRIQGVDTVSASTDAANKAYVDAHGGGLGPFLPLSAGSTKPLTGNLYINDTIPKLIFTDTNTSTIASISANSSNLTYTTVSTARDHTFKGGTSTLMTIEGTGNVGIGTTSPSYRLTAYGSSADSEIVASFGSANDQNEYTAIGLSGFIASNGATKAGLALKRTSTYGTGELHFLNNNTIDNSDMTLSDSKMVILGNGNVGIGTTSPDTSLTIENASGGAASTTYSTTAANANLNLSAVGVPYYNHLFMGIGAATYSWIQSQHGNSNAQNLALNPIGGNVGIGTVSPDNKLEIVGSNALRIHDGTDQGAILFRGDRDDVYIKESNYQLLFGAPSGMVFELDTNSNDGDVLNVTHRGSSRFYVNGANGNVGIGTTNPQQKLDVVGRVRASYNTSNYYEIGASSAGGFVVGKSGGVETVNIRTYGDSHFNGGNVGIGTTSPSATLQVDGQVLISATAPFLDFVDTNSFTDPNDRFRIRAGGNQGLVQWYDDSASSLLTTMTFEPNGNVIVPNGNVGIGTTSPDSQLEVYYETAGSTGAQIKLGSGDVGYETTITNYRRTTDSTFEIASYDDTILGYNRSTDKTWLGIGSNVGIGTTSPGSKLEISSTSDALLELNGGAAANPYMLFAQNGTRRALIQYVNGGLLSLASEYGGIRMMTGTGGTEVERMRIDSSGNVGIGVTSPTNQLHVHTGVDNNYAVRIEGSTNNAAGVWTGLGIGGETNNTKSAVLFEDTGTSYSKGKLHLCVNTESNQNSATPADARLTVSSDRVGIGVTAPEAHLHVEDTKTYMATPPDVFRVSQRSPEITFQDLSSYIAVDIKYQGSTGSTLATHTVQNNPGGAFYKTTFDTGSAGGSEYQQSQNGFHWRINSNSEKLTIATNGNIGINDTTPSYQLDVNGNGRFTSTVTATNFINSSDERLKENIEEVRDNNVEVNWKTFNFKTEKEQKRYGVIAQELEKTNPEFVREDSQGFKSVAYIDLLIAKIAELEARIQKLEK